MLLNLNKISTDHTVNNQQIEPIYDNINIRQDLVNRSLNQNYGDQNLDQLINFMNQPVQQNNSFLLILIMKLN